MKFIMRVPSDLLKPNYLSMKKTLIYNFLFLIAIGAQAQLAYRSTTSGNWNAIATWQVFSGGNWVAATIGQIPGANDTVYIQANHIVALTQNQSCYDLNINTGSGTSLNLSTFLLDIHGRIRAYNSALNTFPVTYTTSNPSIATWLNCTAGGRIRFVGNTRDLNISGQWSANPPFWAVEFALTPGQTGTIVGNFKAGVIIVSSGHIIMTGDFRPDSNANNGDVYINAGATLELRGNSSRTGTLTANYDSLVVNGKLILAGTATNQTISPMNLVVGNGGVITKVNRNALVTNITNYSFSPNAAIEYAAATNQVIGGEYPATLNLPKLIINTDSVVTFNGTRIVTDSLVLLKGILNIVNTDSLRHGINATGRLRRVNGWIIGKYNRYISATTTGNILFPTGTNNLYRPLNMSILTPSSAAGDITVEHIDGGNGGSNITSFLDGSYTINRRSNSYWGGNVNNGFTNFSINIWAKLTGQTGIAAPAETRIIGSTDGGISYGTPGGTHANGSGDTAFRNGFAVMAPMNFRLHFGGNITTNPLPVKLISFAGKINNNQTVLNWQTASEQNNKGFEVETSQDGRIFNCIGFVNGNNNSNRINAYSFVTKQNQSAFYRLKQIDNDGAFEYSNTIYVEHNMDDITILPNPFADRIEVVGSTEITGIEIFDMTGKTKVAAMGNIAETASLSSGVYFIKINSGNNTTVKRIVKQ
jgi:hypothetical protein